MVASEAELYARAGASPKGAWSLKSQTKPRATSSEGMISYVTCIVNALMCSAAQTQDWEWRSVAKTLTALCVGGSTSSSPLRRYSGRTVLVERLKGTEMNTRADMKRFPVVLFITAFAFSIVAYAEVSGSDTATASNRANACYRAKNLASASMEWNHRTETRYPFNPADVPSGVKGCDCSEPSISTPYWTCEAQWRLSSAPDAALARPRGH